MSAVIYLAVAAAWAVLLVPMWLRHHDMVSESRSADRFTTAMRVLARSDGAVLPPSWPGAAASPRMRAAAARTSPRVRAVSPAVRRRRLLAGLLLLLATAVVVAVVLGGAAWLGVCVAGLMLLTGLVAVRTQARAEGAVRSARRVRRDRVARAESALQTMGSHHPELLARHRRVPVGAVVAVRPVVVRAARVERAASVRSEQTTPGEPLEPVAPAQPAASPLPAASPQPARPVAPEVAAEVSRPRQDPPATLGTLRPGGIPSSPPQRRPRLLDDAPDIDLEQFDGDLATLDLLLARRAVS